MFKNDSGETMPIIRPFAGLRPVPERAGDVVAPPYDVLNSAEARELAQDKPWSFLHISKPEIDLPEDTDPYDPVVYRKAAENMEHMIDEGVLMRDDGPRYYIYRLTMGEHSQTGLVAAASVAEYDRNRIRKHEYTRPAKEDDRVNQIRAQIEEVIGLEAEDALEISAKSGQGLGDVFEAILTRLPPPKGDAEAPLTYAPVPPVSGDPDRPREVATTRRSAVLRRSAAVFGAQRSWSVPLPPVQP
jgi:hypothetical protein